MLDRDPHKRPNPTVLSKQSEDGVHWVLMETQWSKSERSRSLHVGSTSFRTNTIAYADFLQLFGFRRSPCKHIPNTLDGCVWRSVNDNFDLKEFRKRAHDAVIKFRRADLELIQCGLRIPLPIDSLYYGGSGYRLREPMPAFAGDGHDTDPHNVHPRLEDDRFRFFHYCFTRDDQHGFAHHISPKGPVSDAEGKALQLIGLHPRQECPFFDCEPCFWIASPTVERSVDNFRDLDDQFHRAHRRYHEKQPGRLATAVDELISCRNDMLPLGWDLFDVLSPAPSGETSTTSTQVTTNDQQSDEIERQMARSSALEISGAATKRRTTLREWANGERLTLAIVFTDIVGSTELGRRVGDESMAQIREAHFEQCRRLIDQSKGRGIKTIGDSFMAAFKSADAALDFMIALRRNTGHPELRIRAGAHIGQVEVTDDDVHGTAVNLASRVVSAITDSDIWLSDRAKEDVDSLASERHKGLRWNRHDGIHLKGFPNSSTLWSLSI